MAQLSISLLGTIQVLRDGVPVSGQAYAKVMGLLAYLAMESDRPHSRATLATLFWPDQPDERARHSLRQALSTLRRLLGEDEDGEILLARRDAVQFSPEAAASLDVRQLLDLLDACDRHPHQRLERCPVCAQRLARIDSLLRGEFLAGFSVDDSAEFDEWVQIWRERLRQRVIPALAALATWHRERGVLDDAVRVLTRQLELDPWLEETHRTLMEVLWQQGNRAAALAQYERCRQVLEDELGIEPDDATTALFERISGARAAPPVNPRIELSTTGRIPVPAGRLVGRERELEELADLLARSDCRLLSLVGPGGSGKTRLALQVALDHQRHGLGGTWFVALEPVRQPDGIVGAIAAELGLSLPAASDPERELRAWLRDRSLLLVLDNAEHLVHGLDVVAGFLDAAPGLTILVTSRERLQLRGEWVYELEGLAVPASDASDSFEGYGAVELFGERLRQVRPRVPLRHEERPAVAAICALVEGMPLALELAAAWAQSLTVEEIADNIRRNLDFLETSLRDVPERHRSMRAVFNQTWQMLEADERITYRRLALFQDGFTLAAAEEIAGTSATHLAALVAKSLLVQHSPGRYHLHSLLAQYARELLAADEGGSGLHDRHAQYYLTWLATLEDTLTGHDQRSALNQIEDDIGNIRAAWAWAAHHRQVDLLVDAIHPLWLFYAIRGWMREGAAAFAAVVDSLDAADDMEAARRPAWARARAASLARAGGFESGLGRYDDGIALIERSITVLRSLGATREVGLGLNMLAAAYQMTGELATSVRLLEESLHEFRAVGDQWGIAYALNDLGLMLHLQDETHDAERHVEQSRAMLRQLGDRRGAAFAAYNLGMIASRRGDHERARQLYRESLSLREEGRDQWGTGASLVQLASETRALGYRAESRELYLAALRTAWNSSARPVVLEALVGVSTLMIDEGDEPGADAILAQVAAHPATPGQLRKRIAALRPGIEHWPGQAGAQPESWAVRAVDETARMLVNEQQNASTA